MWVGNEIRGFQVTTEGKEEVMAQAMGSGWGSGAPRAAMDRPLTGSAEAEEELEWQVASRRRKAWAKCRSSWQASETEDLSTEATTQDEDEDEEEDLPGAQLPAAAGRGNVPNEKIAIWLKDCR
ncbi:protein ITPRID2 isoform X3 [Aotus nancymaae]|uniref:protein ITPRID2 isoform X3 n=1 Tax=Aotus nancymaae TaxID=37293 RepID=UPI000625E16A|nr:sperm-specific antigen 2 isoform X3 [Aotus nancymaae]